MTKLLARLPDADLEHVLAVAAELAGDDASTTLAGRRVRRARRRRCRARRRRSRGSRPSGASARTEVVAFGDHLTDAAMVAWAGHGVAVANAHPAVLAVADEVCASNDDDGVADRARADRRDER